MVCPNLINELCYSGVPSSVVVINDKGKFAKKTLCKTKGYQVCPKFKQTY